jgi:hypothetical protein
MTEARVSLALEGNCCVLNLGRSNGGFVTRRRQVLDNTVHPSAVKGCQA